MRSTFLIVVLSAALAAGAGAQSPDGKALFEANCAKCHGLAGRPSAIIRKMFPEIPTYDDAFFSKRSEDDIIGVLMNGKGKNMKPWPDKLSPQEMAAVARYIRTLKP